MIRRNKKLSDYGNSRLTSSTTLKTNSLIKRQSEVGKKRNEKYLRLRAIHLKKYPICQFQGCTRTDVEVHHKAGRTGDDMFRHFMTVCSNHHRWIHDNIKESKELNYLI